nr:MAG TPA: hypothetical protein [Caudoviricetes sp.]
MGSMTSTLYRRGLLLIILLFSLMIPSFVLLKTLNLDDSQIIVSSRLSLTDYRRDADGLRILYLDCSPI